MDERPGTQARATDLRRGRIAGRLLVLSPGVVGALHVTLLLADPGQGAPADVPSGDPHGYALFAATFLAFVALPVLLSLGLWGGHGLRRQRRSGVVLLLLAAAAGLLQCALFLWLTPAWGPYAVVTLLTVLAVLWVLVVLGCALLVARTWRAVGGPR